MIMKALSNIWTQSAKHFWTKDKKHLKLCFDWIWPENWISNGEEVKLKRPELAGGDDSNLLDANVENVKKKIQTVTASWFDMINNHDVKKNVGGRTVVWKYKGLESGCSLCLKH